jgi:hypothetical protein
MELTRFARYRNARRERADKALEAGDFRTYTDDRGRLWWRVAITTDAYASAEAARAELDRREEALEADKAA